MFQGKIFGKITLGVQTQLGLGLGLHELIEQNGHCQQIHRASISLGGH